MSYPLDIAIKVKNYKSFGDSLSGFESLFPVNVIIGRNNTGKSALIDLIKYAINPDQWQSHLGHQGKIPEVQITKNLTENEIRQIFLPGVSGGLIGQDHWKSYYV